MDQPKPSLQEEERLKSENDTLRRRIRTLEAELQRLQQKLVSTWGDM
jgi:chaperonin cofactor prefoldin